MSMVEWLIVGVVVLVAIVVIAALIDTELLLELGLELLD